ncbi:MAG: Uncharacterized protein Greene041619_819 [Candidatus Peregrinibacteria bacterium Greene0416_19]|nr:MAG: Uncharacterized protein Greene041619_819 [Candidatus Peregrinibacteria bacterium Greene0416_19]
MTWILLIVVAIGVIGLLLLVRRRKRLSAAASSKIRSAWNHAVSLPDTHRRLLEADKVLDVTLEELGYRGTLGEKLKKASGSIPSVNAVWAAHKMRNRIAHEPGASLSDAECRSALQAFERAIFAFLRS